MTHAVTGMRPWLPHALREHGLTRSAVTRLEYLVVDDIVDDIVTVAGYPWPVADDQGRVRFPGLEAGWHLGIALRKLRSQLYRQLARREPRVGDVFGGKLTDQARAWLDTHQDSLWPYPLSALLTGPVYDLSSDARKVAKLAYYAAMTPVLAREHVERWNLADKAEPAAGKAPTLDLGSNHG